MRENELNPDMALIDSRRRIVPLRGRARLEILPDVLSRFIITPESNTLDRRVPRRGRVIALGPPAVTKRGRERPWDCAIGDEVIYVFGQLTTNGKDAWVSQDEILCVVERVVDRSLS